MDAVDKGIDELVKNIQIANEINEKIKDKLGKTYFDS